MADFKVWVSASMQILEENVAILREYEKKSEFDLMTKQLADTKRHIDSFLFFLRKAGIKWQAEKSST